MDRIRVDVGTVENSLSASSRSSVAAGGGVTAAVDGGSVVGGVTVSPAPAPAGVREVWAELSCFVVVLYRRFFKIL